MGGFFPALTRSQTSICDWLQTRSGSAVRQLHPAMGTCTWCCVVVVVNTPLWLFRSSHQTLCERLCQGGGKGQSCLQTLLPSLRLQLLPLPSMGKCVSAQVPALCDATQADRCSDEAYEACAHLQKTVLAYPLVNNKSG